MRQFLKKIIVSVIVVLLLVACGNNNKKSSEFEESEIKDTLNIIYDNYEEFEVIDFGEVFNIELYGKTIGTGGGLYRYKVYDTSEKIKYWDEYKTELINVGFVIQGDTAVKNITLNGEETNITVSISTKYVVDIESHIFITVLVSYKD